MSACIRIGLLGLVLAIVAQTAQSEELIVDFMFASGQQRSAWVAMLKRFSDENPDIQLISNAYNQEDYKKDFATHLSKDRADVAFWFAGERLRDAITRQQLRAIDADQVEYLLTKRMVPATIDASRVNGSIYGLPLSYYPWGFFYRKSIFAHLGLAPPETWSEFIALCQRLKKEGVVPLAVGNKDGWPAAAWFDYLDLRLNGLDYHRRLLSGRESFDNPRTREVFRVWKELLQSGYFLNDTMDKSWDEVLPYFYRDRVAMILMGGFVASKFPPGMVADIDFFRFPQSSPDMPDYEDAPLDILVFPVTGGHHQAVRRFIYYLVQSDALLRYNLATSMTPPLNDVAKSGNELLDRQYFMLKKANGLAFYFDRDARAALVPAAFEGFRQFLQPPHDIDRAIHHIEQHARP